VISGFPLLPLTRYPRSSLTGVVALEHELLCTFVPGLGLNDTL
jgi:hypothetical protein